MTSWSLLGSIALGKGGIGDAHAARQKRTAEVALERLNHQAGLIVADEVGMGKTFVALAVAASASKARNQPAVVMCPPRLVDKWERDAARFDRICYRGHAPGLPPFARTAHTGAEFLKCFDDPEDRRAHLVILANTALHRTERDPWVKLSVVKRALAHMNASETRVRTIARYARDILRSSHLGTCGETEFVDLLNTRIDGWRSYLVRAGQRMDDDPVPAAFYKALKPRHLTRVAEVLEAVPMRESPNLEERVRHARDAIDLALKEVWPDALHAAQITSPLLVFDEAHHLKNADTHLAKLFEQEETASVVAGNFDRMLFLTATPFQLGHHELLGVLHRFCAVRWDTLGGAPARERFEADLSKLADALDHAQTNSLTLDRLWGKLTPADVSLDATGEVAPDTWQLLRKQVPTEGPLGSVLQQFATTRTAFKKAEALLAPWVVRHVRERTFSTDDGDRVRRHTVTGRGIRDGQATTDGIALDGDAKFPFLLCARAQGLLARDSRARAYFAEGLSSSYGAFLETSKPNDDADIDLAGEDEAGDVGWYVHQVRALLGEQRAASDHPKIAATVDCAIRHWREGHKVLIFGHYRKTIADLSRVLAERLDHEVLRTGAKALGLAPDDTQAVEEQLKRIAERLADKDSPMHKEVYSVLSGWVAQDGVPQDLHAPVVQCLLDVLRTRTFLVRHLPLDRPEVRESLASPRATATQARAAAQAVADSLMRRHGRKGASYRERVTAFLRHFNEDLVTRQEQESLLKDLSDARVNPVEHADGGVAEETRRRRLRGFNSPLMPEILVASEVMAEGLDLHLDCRHIIHHDLSWNPSTLEQRTGRVDRLRCKAELDGESIHVYLPYVAGTADEKMFRVVTDRARWFQIVMGEKYAVDEASTEKHSRRIPLPEVAAKELIFALEVTG